MPFAFKSLEISDVILVEGQAFGDDRGFLAETYKLSEFAAKGILGPFVQDNYSHSIKGVLRGLHYQKDPRAQGKLVSVVGGEIFDVAVDIRRGSPTFGRWVGEKLSRDSHRMMWVPEGFAHGFEVLSDEADVVYKVTSEYSPEHDRGIIYSDQQIGVQWPIERPILSDKDQKLPSLMEADINFKYGG